MADDTESADKDGIRLQDDGRSLLEAYALFYLLAAALGLPAILLCIVLARAQPKPAVI